MFKREPDVSTWVADGVLGGIDSLLGEGVLYLCPDKC